MDWQQTPVYYESIPISNKEFAQISGLMYQYFGINFSEKKKVLVKTRLNQYLINHGYHCFNDFYQNLVSSANPALLLDLAERLTTNYTFFFRETEHFHFLLKTILPQIQKNKEERENKTIRIWSAGCSSGEEPYSLAILLHDYFSKSFDPFEFKILATDISLKVLEKAQIGIYPKDVLKNVPDRLLKNYFTPLDNDAYQVNQKIKEMVTIRRLNLMSAKFPFHESFDIIFCRNVMIYFDDESRKKLIQQYYQHTREGGYLIIGHSESLHRRTTLYQYIQPSIYRKGN
ncbi:MAG: protein-glutamate O-methyltransferase CheR [Spirochaetes bacterium]|nr:protein-glutamate O-methyltransferase CheR [Spirochaetota bacterium]